MISITVGVTGHRDLSPRDAGPLFQAVKQNLLALKQEYPNTEITVLSPLAEGADQLCAQAALEAGCRLVAPLPMEPDAYTAEFSPEGKARFAALCGSAESTFVVPWEEEPPEKVTDGFLYRQAGIYVAMRSHILLALWDGLEVRSPEGGGTFETVDFMLRENWRRKSPDKMLFKPLRDGTVWHILTPREGCPPPEGTLFSRRVLGSEGESQPFGAALADTDAFNADALRCRSEIESHLPRAARELLGGRTVDDLSPHHKTLLELFAAADCLSLRFRQMRLRALRQLSSLGTLLVLLFLLYDEMESDLMLPLYAVALIAAFCIHRRARKGGCHEKYIGYRFLAEALRIQLYWELAGMEERVWEQYTWAQRGEMIWVKEALTAIDVGPPAHRAPLPDGEAVLRKCWVEGQRDYHKAAAASKGSRLGRNDRISRLLLGLAVGMFVLVCLLEWGFKGAMTATIPTGAVEGLLLMHPGQEITVRGVMKILLGVVSAGAALLGNYFSKLSLPVQAKDNEKMARLYDMAAQRLNRPETCGGDGARLIFYQLGREAVVENGNWMLDYLQQGLDIVL